MSAGTRYSASHPILAIRSCFNLEGYSVGVVLRFVGFGPPSGAKNNKGGRSARPYYSSFPKKLIE